MHAHSDGRLVEGKPFVERVPEPAAAIRIARDFDIPSVLPFAYYTLACIPFGFDWDDYHNPLRSWSLSVQQLSLARWHMLDVVDMGRVVRGREELMQSMAADITWATGDTVEDALASVDEDCNGIVSPCSDKAKAIQEQWKQSLSADLWTARCPSPLDVLQRLYKEHSQWHLCEECTGALKRCIRSRQRVTWNRLGYIFGVNC